MNDLCVSQNFAQIVCLRYILSPAASSEACGSDLNTRLVKIRMLLIAALRQFRFRKLHGLLKTQVGDAVDANDGSR